MGNGGSAATASHIATDWSKTAERVGKPLIRCMSLNDNVAFMTAIGNDLGYDHLFSRQLQNLLQRGDVVVIISGSGNSPNVIKAAEYAREEGRDDHRHDRLHRRQAAQDGRHLPAHRQRPVRRDRGSAHGGRLDPRLLPQAAQVRGGVQAADWR
jgi:hypothetical protein